MCDCLPSFLYFALISATAIHLYTRPSNTIYCIMDTSVRNFHPHLCTRCCNSLDGFWCCTIQSWKTSNIPFIRVGCLGSYDLSGLCVNSAYHNTFTVHHEVSQPVNYSVSNPGHCWNATVQCFVSNYCMISVSPGLEAI